jgi:hypothetical protein
MMRALLLGFILLAAVPALAGEKYVGSNVDVRTADDERRPIIS